MAYYPHAARWALQHNGGTFTAYGEVVTHGRGYYVGGLVPTTIVRKADGDTWSLDWLGEQLERFARQHERVLFTGGDKYLGTWVNEGNVYIDATQWVGDRDEAIALGRERGELAVWGCKAGKEVQL